MYLYTAYVFSPYHSYLTNQSRYILLYHTTWLYFHTKLQWHHITLRVTLSLYILLHYTKWVYPVLPVPQYLSVSHHTILHWYKLPYQTTTVFLTLTCYMVTSYYIMLPLNILSYHNIWVNPTSPHFIIYSYIPLLLGWILPYPTTSVYSTIPCYMKTSNYTHFLLISYHIIL